MKNDYMDLLKNFEIYKDRIKMLVENDVEYIDFNRPDIHAIKIKIKE